VPQSKSVRLASVAVAALTFVATLSVTALVVSPAASVEAGGASPQTFTRRLTPDQYKTIIADVFGKDIRIGGRFDPGLRVNGLLEVGAGEVSVSATGMEQYDAMARSIANQIIDDKHRRLLISCEPKANDKPDAECATQFLGTVGKLLFRRPLTSEELNLHVEAAAAAALVEKDFYKGLALSLAGMLSQPQFLFRHEVLEADPDRKGAYRLDAYSKASRLSFLLWNSGPDERLLEAAENGEMSTQKGLTRQVERMVRSPRLASGVRAFFSDMFHFDQFDGLIKDTQIYPKFSSQVAVDSRDQTLRTVVDHLLVRKGDYRDIFTTKKTFMTKALAAVYKVPFGMNLPNGSPDAWMPYEFSEDDPRAGILTHISFVALHSHPGRSSPTLRGKALREIMLCQKVPSPPGDVDFTLVQDTASEEYKTARARLTAHSTEPACAGCHKITDPIGLALENFNGGGEWQTTENGATIDTSGALDGVSFSGGEGLGEAVRNNDAVASCLVNRMAAYALGKKPGPVKSQWVSVLESKFADSGYLVPDLMKEIAVSPELFRVSSSNLDELTMLMPRHRPDKEGE